MSCQYLLQDKQTGVSRWVTDEYCDKEYDGRTADHNDFIWDEGNYSCDCNRHLFFWREVGIEPDSIECGDDQRYVILDRKHSSPPAVPDTAKETK